MKASVRLLKEVICDKLGGRGFMWQDVFLEGDVGCILQSS